jgi:hypothetical protein
MSNVTVARPPSGYLPTDSESFDGLVDVLHLDTTGSSLPPQVALFTPEVGDRQQLDVLFPMCSINDTILERLRPSHLNPAIFSTSQFKQSLAAWQGYLQKLSLEQPSEARKFGRLAGLLKEKDALRRLANMYSSALLQG